MTGHPSIRDAERRWSRRARALPRVAADHIEAVTEDALPAIEEATPVRTGKLRRGWSVYRQGVRVELRNAVRYAGFVAAGQLSEVAEKAVSESLRKAESGSDSLSHRLFKEG